MDNLVYLWITLDEDIVGIVMGMIGEITIEVGILGKMKGR